MQSISVIPAREDSRKEAALRREQLIESIDRMLNRVDAEQLSGIYHLLLHLVR